MHTRTRVLAASILVAALSCLGSNAIAQDKKGNQKVDKAAQAEQLAAVKMMDDVVAGQPAPSDFSFTFTSHVMKSRDNKMYVPFIITFDKAKPVPSTATYYVRVVNKANIEETMKKVAEHKAAMDKAAARSRLDPENAEAAEAEAKLRAEAPRVDYAFEDLRLAQPITAGPTGAPRYLGALAAPAGDYDVYVMFKEPTNQKDKKATPKATVMKVPVTVPNLWSNELATSTVFVTNQAEGLKAPPTQDDLTKNPYIFGMMKISPVLDAAPKFKKTDELSVVFYIYNTGIDQATSKPNLTVEYNFYRKDAGAEKFFNKTDPQQLNDKTLGPNFDLKAGHQLLGGQGVPLASFPEGDYRLEIKITDKVTNKTKVENSNFSVIAG